ncbi:MAG: thiolase, partial [Nocardioides sp.]
FASNQRSARSRSLGGAYEAHTPEAQFEQPYGPLYPASYYAMAAGQYLHRHDATREDLAEVAVAAREWALLNPAAFRHQAGPLTVADVLAAKPVSTPLTAADCCLVTDGGGAVVLTSLERARDLPRPPVVVLGYGESTTNASMSAVDDLTVTGAVASGAAAFGRAGLTPADVDVAQLYDSFTITVLLTLEALGFCGPGEAPSVVRDRKLALNTSGGGLSYCHPGQFGVLLLVEAARQLRGECGARQVDGAEVALAHGTGGILSTHATVLLGVDR